MARLRLRSFAGRKPRAEISAATEPALTFRAASRGAEQSGAAPGAQAEQAAGCGNYARLR